MGRRFMLRLMVIFTTISFGLMMVIFVAWSQGLGLEGSTDTLLTTDLAFPSETEESEATLKVVQLLADDPDDDLHSFHSSLGVRDKSQRYFKHPFVVTGSAWKELSQRPVCLATHATLDHLHHLVDTARAWSGPISVAVFTPDIEYKLTRIYIRYLRTCFPELRRKVSFHLVHPAEHPARWDDDTAAAASVSPGDAHLDDGPVAAATAPLADASCDEAARDVLRGLLARRPPEMLRQWRNELPYPQNLMRNLARASCPGRFLFCPDVDMVVTMEGFDEAVAAFLESPSQHRCQRCAYIVPVYEVREDQEPPANKSQLLQIVQEKKARPFHIEVFRPNQGMSNLPKWENSGQGEILNVSYKVEKFKFFYEPVYIASRDVPPFDERFVGFGHTRNTQAYEMYVAGWKFYVLNNVFLVHWGFQKLSSRPPWRERQARANSRRFPAFLRELAVRYDRDPLDMLKKYQRGNYHFLVQPSISVQ